MTFEINDTGKYVTKVTNERISRTSDPDMKTVKSELSACYPKHITRTITGEKASDDKGEGACRGRYFFPEGGVW